MKKLIFAVTAIFVWWTWPHRGVVILWFRRLCVNLGIHFPVPFMGVCICGLQTKLLSGLFWFDRAQFLYTAAGGITKNRHAIHQELQWYHNLDRKRLLADACARLLRTGVLEFVGKGADDWDRWIEDEYEEYPD